LVDADEVWRVGEEERRVGEAEGGGEGGVGLSELWSSVLSSL
jgi:hypothetical protein